jgi:hypothetical protein
MADDRKQDIELGLTRPSTTYEDERRAVLTIDTGKSYNGGIRSTATVFWCNGRSRSHAFGIGNTASGDWSKQLKQTERTVKATQKAIDRQHAEVFTAEVIADLAAKAKTYYEG